MTMMRRAPLGHVRPGTGPSKSADWSRIRPLPALLWGIALLLLAAPITGQGESVLRVQVSGAITPVVADHVVDGLARAENDQYAAYLVELDTPGGLDTSVREIVRALLDANVPVIVYLTPSGAGTGPSSAIIAFAAHVAAMSPGTTIGSGAIDPEPGDKLTNAAAYAEAIAAERGRSTEFAIATVRNGRSATEHEAVDIGAVDLVASDISALLLAADGRTVVLGDGSRTVVQTAGASMVDYEFGFLRSLLGALADPSVTLIILSIGTLALIGSVAAASRRSGVPGRGPATVAVAGAVAGVMLLVLGFAGLGALPVDVAGLLVLAAIGVGAVCAVCAVRLAVRAAHRGRQPDRPSSPALPRFHCVGEGILMEQTRSGVQAGRRSAETS